jgi:nicotinamide phosphoribosyltransferase
VVALDFIGEYYPPNPQRGNTRDFQGGNRATPPLGMMAKGFSIPAAEHSTITSWGRENEVVAYENMLDQYPEGLVAVVSDSYDIYNACASLWGGVLKEKILNRKGTLVVRPDSGIPKDIVLEIVTILGEKFGYTTNEKGYKVLHPNIRVIQGDGVDYVSIGEILDNLKNAGWSADNIAFGMGGALLQKLDRDTQKFAFKCSAALINGQEIEVYKDPITDQGKKSKRGRLKLVQTETGFVTKNQHEEGKDCLVPVFKNGRLMKKYDFEGCRKNVSGNINAPN